MLVGFFQAVREARVPATLREFLDLLEALTRRHAFANLDDFYYLSRACLVKDEKYFDKYDQAFAGYFKESALFSDAFSALIPDEWLQKKCENSLSKEERDEIARLGGLDKLMEAFKQRLEEQDSPHFCGPKWIGTGGTSAFGAFGDNPEGIRIGQQEGRQGSAVKVWERREFKNLDDSVELGTRNIKVALKRLRQFARSGAAEELDLDDTIRSTARNAGYLDLKMVPERHNAVKVLLFIDVGGSMWHHVRACEELFSATRSEFKYMEYFYFHNFIYENVWKDNRRRRDETIPTWDILHKYGNDYKVIFVGDAAMSHFEITQKAGSIEHWNEESGETWFRRLSAVYPKLIWLNPKPQKDWGYTRSVGVVNELVGGRMYPLTLAGLDEGIKFLAR